MKSSNKIKILIIDDEADILFTIQEICSIAGYETLTATNGKEGYELCKLHQPNLAIVDYHMPGWSGLITVKQIREIDTTASILVLTVDERQEVSDRFIEIGATDFAIKPIKAPDLIARINVNLKINEMQKKIVETRKSAFVDKGISPSTLKIICDFLKLQKENLTVEEITNGVGLAYQTVHRYVQYLLENEKLEVIPAYGQLGRPKNKYKLLE
ncbi:MAG: response regulator [Clostridia bacterium]|jgi:two-component system response regulator DctR|nr:response regulator [Clostridia bacterium]